MRVKSLVINWSEPAEPWRPGGTFPRRPRSASPCLLVLAITLVFVIGKLAASPTDQIKPDPKLTPGLVRRTDVCGTTWGRDARHVTIAMKKQVAGWYHVAWSRHAQYEFDHLVPRELGGADDVRNIWPQPRSGTWTAHKKDVLENRLHRLVCAGRLSLAEAQARITKDWIGAYKVFCLAR